MKYLYIYIYDDDIICNYGNIVNKFVFIYFFGIYFKGENFKRGIVSGVKYC